MSDHATSLLTRLWYFAMPAAALRPGAMTRKVLLGQPVLFGRGRDGAVFAIRDICPHRGVPLTSGRMIDGDGAPEVECPYHGWRFGPHGRCTGIPSLVEGQAVETENIRVRRYPVRERQGLIWIYMSDAPAETAPPGDEPEPDLEPPEAPGVGERTPKLVFGSPFRCHVDHAVIGLMDPAHGPYVHGSWWWRTKTSMHEKAKRFGPVERGFSMLKHQPSSNSFAYKLLGGKPTTEIVFQLPGVRTELVRVGERFVCGLTAVTPVTETETEVTQIFWWDLPLLSVLKPVFARFGKAFLKQDRDMVELQREGLRFNPRLMLINDADVQAKWYFRLKKAWAESVDTGSAFVNPVKEEVTLRWRS